MRHARVKGPCSRGLKGSTCRRSSLGAKTKGMLRGDDAGPPSPTSAAGEGSSWTSSEGQGSRFLRRQAISVSFSRRSSPPARRCSPSRRGPLDPPARAAPPFDPAFKLTFSPRRRAISPRKCPLRLLVIGLARASPSIWPSLHPLRHAEPHEGETCQRLRAEEDKAPRVGTGPSSVDENSPRSTEGNEAAIAKNGWRALRRGRRSPLSKICRAGRT